MKKIYLIKFEDCEERVYNCCYATKELANNAIEELKQNKDFLENFVCPEEINFWVEEVELIKKNKFNFFKKLLTKNQ